MSSLARVDNAYLSAPCAINHLWAYLTHLAYISSWSLTQWGELSYLYSGIPHPLFNLFYGDVDTLSATQKIEVSTLAKKTPSLWIQKEKPADVGTDFFSEFLHLKNSIPVHGLTFETTHTLGNLLLDTGFHLQQISTYEELSSFDRISAECFGHEAGMALEFMRGLSLKKDRNALQLFLIYRESLPVGGFQLFCHEGVRGLYWACILPQYQQKGIGTAVLARVFQETQNHGFNHLVSSFMPSCMGVLKHFIPREIRPLELYAISPTQTLSHE